jgi:hypothetical protein
MSPFTYYFLPIADRLCTKFKQKEHHHPCILFVFDARRCDGTLQLVLIIYCLTHIVAWNENAENASGIIQQTRTNETKNE